MEENIQKFTERLRELVAQGKKKKSILEIQEINDFFADMELEAEQMEKVFRMHMRILWSFVRVNIRQIEDMRC